MIYLFTDFGLAGPYVGQMKSVIQAGSNTPVIDFMHDAPAFNARASAYLLAALIPYLQPESIMVAVVDPGVGSRDRRPLLIKADSHWYVGPDNGLFAKVIAQAESVTCYELSVGDNISKSFHGRDVFAPAAGQLANQQMPAALAIDKDTLIGMDIPANLAEVIYIDHYGNAMTGIAASSMDKEHTLKVSDCELCYAETFSSVPEGELFWYENSIGLVELSKNSGDAAQQLKLNIGSPVDLLLPDD